MLELRFLVIETRRIFLAYLYLDEVINFYVAGTEPDRCSGRVCRSVLCDESYNLVSDRQDQCVSPDSQRSSDLHILEGPRTLGKVEIKLEIRGAEEE